jgi:tetratricopeptide (TPR) repeat protein
MPERNKDLFLPGGAMSKRRFAFVVFPGVALAVGACASLPQAGKQRLLEARRCYDGRDWAGAERAAGLVIAAYPNAEEIAEAYYLRGLSRVRDGRATEALADLREARRRSKRKDLACRADIAVGMVLQEQGAYARAASSYDRAVEGKDVPDLLAEALFNLGLCRERAGQWRAARQAFDRLLRRFPSDPHAVDARRHAAWPHQYFAIQCGVFRNRANASSLLGRLRGQGLDAYIESRPTSRAGDNAVRVGRFGDYSAAGRALPSVRRVVPDAFIVP